MEGLRTKETVQRISGRINAPAKASLFYTLGSAASRAAAFLLTPIMTRLLSASDYGAYSLFNSLLSAMTVVGTLDICGSVLWRAMQKFQGDRARLLRSALILIIICSASALLLLPAALRALGRASLFPGGTVILAASLLSNGVINLYSSACRFNCRYGFPLTAGLILGALAPAIGCAVALFQGRESEYALSVKVGICAGAGLLLALPVAVRIIRGRGAADFNEGEGASTVTHLKFLLRLALPMLPYYLSLSVIAQADKLIISRILGDGAVGAYGVAHSAGSALAALCAGVCASLTPWIMRKVRQGELSRVGAALSKGLLLSAPLALCIISLIPEVFSFLAPSVYSDGLGAVYPLTLGCIPLILAGLVNSAALTYDRTGGILLSGVLPAILSIALNLILIGRLGIFASGAIACSAYMLMLAISLINFRRLSGKAIFKVNNSLHIILFCVFFAMASYVFRESLAARLALLILPLSALIHGCIRAKDLLAERAV